MRSEREFQRPSTRFHRGSSSLAFSLKLAFPWAFSSRFTPEFFLSARKSFHTDVHSRVTSCLMNVVVCAEPTTGDSFSQGYDGVRRRFQSPYLFLPQCSRCRRANSARGSCRYFWTCHGDDVASVVVLSSPTSVGDGLPARGRYSVTRSFFLATKSRRRCSSVFLLRFPQNQSEPAGVLQVVWVVLLRKST